MSPRGTKGPKAILRTEACSAARATRSLQRILEENPLCAVATLGPRGRVHINTAYFAWSPDFEFYFLSDPRSVHARNLQSNRSAALAVFRSPQPWGGDDRGVQLFGTCSETRGSAANRAERAYARRFPSYAAWTAGRGSSPQQTAQLRSYRFYRFVPGRVKILDESEFGGAVFVEGTFRTRR